MTIKLMSKYIRELLKNDKRIDERKLDQFRKISVEYGISKESAEGSVRVKIGETEVLVGVKLEVGTPFPDRPDEGTIMVNAELRPIASPDFETGPPGIDSIELSRVTDRAIRESGAFDFKKLCIKEGEKIWLVVIDVVPINDDGNLFDAASLGAVAALNDAKMPKFDGEKIDYSAKKSGKIPFEELPISCTVIKIGDKLLVDPNKEEWESLDARLSVGITSKGEVCSLQKGGDVPLTEKEVFDMIKLAKAKTKELKKAL